MAGVKAMDIGQLTAFLGWCVVINFAILTVATLMLWAMQGAVARVHAGIFGMDAAEMPAAYIVFLSQYKLLTLVFFVTPWLALRIM
jgi:hypothetical protein